MKTPFRKNINHLIKKQCKYILEGLSPLICLEDENGNVLSSRANSRIRISKDQAIEYQPDFPYLYADPRINFLKIILRIIFSQGALINNNLFQKPSAFRLRRHQNWLVRTPITNLLNQMTWDCKANCTFCFQQGNPPFMRIKKRISKEEIQTRLKYFDPKRNLGLMGGAYFEFDESLNNPYIREILKEIRKKDRNKMLEIVTNGIPLNLEMIKILDQAKPLLLIVSLNSADPKIRKQLMNDSCPEVAIASLPLLKKYKIPYIVSVVIWPGIPFSDIEKTIYYAEKNDAYAIRLALPGFSKFFPKNKKFNASQHETKVIKYFYPRLKKYKIPILIIPHTFVPYLMKRIGLPRIVGTVINSPAQNYGIKPGDIIKEINGQPVDFVEEARDLLKQNLSHNIIVKIERNNDILNFKLKDAAKDCYPYEDKNLRQNAPFGFLLEEKVLSHEDIMDISRYINIYNAKYIMVLTSIRARPFLKFLLKKLNIPRKKEIKINIVTPKNKYFGGNINCLDMFVVEDFIDAIKKNMKKSKPDLVILPASPFNDWGRDLSGQINLNIERKISIPVEFIYHYSGYTD
jgi:uncharacterized Fe-S cluster-containing radical SAM superfamily enzyme